MVRALALLQVVVLGVFLVFLAVPQQAGAAATLEQTTNAVIHNSTTVTATFGAGVTSGNLLVAICGSQSGTITGPTGFTTAINQAGTPSQGIFYRIAAGSETSLSCTNSTSTFNGIHIYEYSGIDTSTPLHTTGSATGTSASPSSGSLTTSNDETLLLAGVTIGGQTAFSAWNNSFTERNDFAISNGAAGSRQTFGGADRSVTSTGTYSTTATAGASSAWRGQIVAFNVAEGALATDIVDSGGNSVANPSIDMDATQYGLSCQTSTGTFGENNQRIRVEDTQNTQNWSLSIAATGGETSTWSNGTDDYSYNDPSGSGCDNGQLTVDPSVATITPESGGCTGVSTGGSGTFASGSVSSITLMSANGAPNNCFWDLTGVELSQTIPAVQPTGTYSIDMTLTVTAE